MSIADFFKRKRKKHYFALVLSDKPLDDAKFENDKECRIFITTGEVDPKIVIPPTVMKSSFEKLLMADQPVDKLKITEKVE